MTSFGLCKVFHYKYNTTGHNFTGHYYVLQCIIHLFQDDNALVHASNSSTGARYYCLGRPTIHGKIADSY